MTVQNDRNQLSLELINRARLDPAGEAARYGLSSLSAGTGMTITTTPKQVLAPSQMLLNAAAGHTSYLLANDAFSHTGRSGSSPHERIGAANYAPANSYGSGENIAWAGSTGSIDANAYVYSLHKNLFLSAGHRSNILYGSFEEYGASAVYDSNYKGYKALLTTHNFGYTSTADNFITGVSYSDTDNNNFYSIGESRAGQTVSLYSGSTRLDSATTSASGGYAVSTTANGKFEVVWSGGGLTESHGVFVTLGSKNIKVDFTDNTTIETNATAVLSRDALNLKLIGIENVNGTGNSLSNFIVGNKGENVLSGGAGNDSLFGGLGNDELIAGTGNDKLVGNSGYDTMIGGSGDDRYSVSSTGDIVNETASDGSGNDTIYAYFDFSLAPSSKVLGEVENLVLSGGTALKATGNDLNNTLTGNSNNNTLYGMGGNDKLNGGLGNDVLYGGSGADQFVFADTKFGKDRVGYFSDDYDKLVFASAVADSFSDFSISGNGSTSVTVSVLGQSVQLASDKAISLTADDFLFY
jgi:Ca2+-binding RTX toxin-like protein